MLECIKKLFRIKLNILLELSSLNADQLNKPDFKKDENCIPFFSV